MKRELQMLEREPPHGVTCWPKDGKIDLLEAQLLGDKDTPFEGGTFKLEIRIPERYPLELPKARFLTKIYHPNIDTAGRICLDILKMAPQGSWSPAHNVNSLLTSIQQLLTYPNPDDGLMADISHEYKHDRPKFKKNAREWVRLYALEEDTGRRSNVEESKQTSAEVETSTKTVAIGLMPSNSNTGQKRAAPTNSSVDLEDLDSISCDNRAPTKKPKIASSHV